MYDIRNGVLHLDGQPVKQTPSPHHSGALRSQGIIVHDTAGRLNKGGTGRWFQNPAAKASAHFVIERDGTIEQCVNAKDKAWHAGRSSYKGRSGVNNFAHGIEIVNVGRMTPHVSGGMAWYGKYYDDMNADARFEEGKWDLDEKATPQHGSGVWMYYTSEQIESVIDLCQALKAEYPAIAWIETHWKISPGRKVDTNPLFPLKSVRSRVFGRGDDDGGAETIVEVNMRRWPSYSSTIIRRVGKGTAVEIIRSGEYPTGDCQTKEQWHLCEIDDNQGWINAEYVELD